MKICIIGAGHIGTTLAGYMSNLNNGNKIVLHSGKADKFNNDGSVIVNDIEKEMRYVSIIDIVTDNYEIAVSDSDIIFVTVPHFLIDDLFKTIKPYVKKGAMLGVIPGSGGVEFLYKKYFSSDVILFGFQRVPFTAKLVEYGKETNLKSWKPAVQVASIPINKLDDVCDAVSATTGFVCEKCANYLNVTLTPSNPVLHTSRIYDMFGRYDPDYVFEQKHKFYYEWTDHASEVMINVDGELHSLFESLPEIDFSSVKPLTVHYESPDVKSMTNKIISIRTFQSVFAPLKEVEKGFIADISSRMFVEDFPYGLCIIKGFCNIMNIATPNIDEELKWFSKYLGYEYYVGDDFCGKDLVKTGIPQNYGIRTKEDIINFYL